MWVCLCVTGAKMMWKDIAPGSGCRGGWVAGQSLACPLEATHSEAMRGKRKGQLGRYPRTRDEKPQGNTENYGLYFFIFWSVLFNISSSVLPQAPSAYKIKPVLKGHFGEDRSSWGILGRGVRVLGYNSSLSNKLYDLGQVICVSTPQFSNLQNKMVTQDHL